ncbi:MAG: YqeG family HAD IIIA-type phosphatase [Pirellulaceae bacterium]|nr:YqeG family HAD IIIA-type phosphatase [Pirellulaceae bacterium]
MASIFTPHLRVSRVEQLDFELLGRLQLEALLLDVDCTLKEYRSLTVPGQIVEWVDSLRERKIGMCLVSNGRGRRIGAVAEQLGLPLVSTALKPFPRGCRRALAEQNFDPRHTAMVGDQVLADVVAGRSAGLFTILVDPIHPEQEPWFTRAKRPLERYLVRGVEREKPRLVQDGAD